MAIKWIFSYESTNDNEMPQTLIEDIEPAFEMIRPIPIILVCLGIFFVRIPFLILAQLKPFEKMIHHLETLLHMNGDVAIQTKTLVQKPFIQTESTLINVSINILLMVVILPIVEELLFRELIPYILSTVTKNQYFSTSNLSLGLSSLVFVLLHFSQSISTLFALILLTIALTIFRMKYGLLQSMALHQCWNAINITLMLISIVNNPHL